MGLDKPNGQQHVGRQRIPEGSFDARDYFAHLHFDLLALHQVVTYLLGALVIERVLYYVYYLIKWVAE